MPKRTDIKTILIIGSGPIVIGQGCEFDYSGTQACKALKAEGYRVVLVNSNPATIMTDPEFSDRTYIEPINPASVRKIIQKQRDIGDPIDALLPTLGGQTALNCACALFDDGTLSEFNVQMIGADRRVIHRAEDRQIFKDIVLGLGLKMPKAKTVTTLADAREFLKEIGLPAIIRPAFTLGGSGGGIAYNAEEFDEIVSRGLRMSPITQVQIDQSVLGWKEYELEVVRDKKDNAIIVCGIENIDPMGVHTGDSITVAPILTLTDKEYQAMRDAAIAIMRAVGVETGGSNVQFAVDPNPADGKFHMVVVEMNPRVSRSSALASKATGFPIAKIAAKLAVGYTLDELRNDITGTTSACFEPAIDYVVTKMPRWTFEKFPEADETLTTQMKSVGEAMAIGRTFCESFQKAIRSMEVKRFGYGLDRNDKWLAAVRACKTVGLSDPRARQPVVINGVPEGSPASTTPIRTADNEVLEWPIPEDKLSRKLSVPSQGRLYYIRYAFKQGWSAERIFQHTKIDPWFLDQLKRLVEFEDVLCGYTRLEDLPREVMFEAKQLGYSDAQLANLYLGSISPDTILHVRQFRKSLAVEPVYKLVDTCAAEFEAITPYYYSTYETGTGHWSPDTNEGIPHPQVPGAWSLVAPEDEIRVSDKKKIIIVGGGPNRIGQGIEFDYCCVHASFAARDLGFESVMINSNPETVSTDYDTSDLLFFEPLTLEDVLNVVERLNGGQLLGTPALRAGRDHIERTSWKGETDRIAWLSNKLRAEGNVALNPVGFVGRDPYPPGIYGPVADLVRTKRNLPHLKLPGATYFVTWKTVDGMTLRGQDYDDAMNALVHFDNERCRVYAAVVMSNHIHWIVRPFDGVELDDLITSVKRFSAKHINARRGTTGSVWEAERFDHIIRDREYFNKFVAYVVENPVEAGIVGDAWEYSHVFVHQDAEPELANHEETPGSESRGTQNQDLVHGLIVQFGGQTPLNLAKGLLKAGAPIIGTSVDSIDLAEDRDRFDALLTKLGLSKPPSGIARSVDQAVEIAERIGYPVLVRPSYVLGGRGMEICSDKKALTHYMATAVNASELDRAPVLIDRFLSDATEVDVDVVADFAGGPALRAGSLAASAPIQTAGSENRPTSNTALIAGVMEHIEEAGIHSGDSACTIPPYSLAPAMVKRIEEIGRRLAEALQINGLMNAQLAIKDDQVFVLEVNPRASRTVPFVAKATQVPWARIAAMVMMGKRLSELPAAEVATRDGHAALPYFSVKEVVFPFNKFPGVDVVLGPEMRSTGEVMGADRDFAVAFAKAQLASGTSLPTKGNVFISVRNDDRHKVHPVARQLNAMGFTIFCSAGTGEHLKASGIACTVLPKIASGLRGHVLDLMADGKIQLIINTPTKTGWQTDEGKIRSSAVRLSVPMITTVTGAAASVRAIAALRAGDWGVLAMQDYKAMLPETHPARRTDAASGRNEPVVVNAAVVAPFRR